MASGASPSAVTAAVISMGISRSLAPHVEAGVDNRHQAASGVHIGMGDAQTLTQRQHLEVAVGYARQSSQRHRVVIGARCDVQQARRIGRCAVLAPEVHFIAGRKQRGPVRLMRRPE